MRVVFVNPSAELGGSERSLFDLVASLRESGLPVNRSHASMAARTNRADRQYPCEPHTRCRSQSAAGPA